MAANNSKQFVIKKGNEEIRLRANQINTRNLGRHFQVSCFIFLSRGSQGIITIFSCKILRKLCTRFCDFFIFQVIFFYLFFFFEGRCTRFFRVLYPSHLTTRTVPFVFKKKLEFFIYLFNLID